MGCYKFHESMLDKLLYGTLSEINYLGMRSIGLFLNLLTM